MSKISLQPNASGTGTFTLAAPDSNTNRTLTLPDEAGVVLTDGSDLAADKLTGDIAADRMKDGFNATGSAPVFACRAFVNFDGTGPTILGSGNVSSITKIGTGVFDINYAVAMPDTNYAVASSSRSGQQGFGIGGVREVDKVRVHNWNTGTSTNSDQTDHSVIIFR